MWSACGVRSRLTKMITSPVRDKLWAEGARGGVSLSVYSVFRILIFWLPLKTVLTNSSCPAHILLFGCRACSSVCCFSCEYVCDLPRRDFSFLLRLFFSLYDSFVFRALFVLVRPFFVVLRLCVTMVTSAAENREYCRPTMQSASTSIGRCP